MRTGKLFWRALRRSGGREGVQTREGEVGFVPSRYFPQVSDHGKQSWRVVRYREPVILREGVWFRCDWEPD